MLDPITALNVVGVIVQFLELSVKFVSEGYKISKPVDGALAKNVDLEKIADVSPSSLRGSVLQLPGNRPHTATTNETSLEEIADSTRS